MSLLLLLALILAFPNPAPAQTPPLFLVNSETGVASVVLDFPEGRSLDEGRLRNQILLQEPGMGTQLQGWVGFLPLVPSPSYPPFHPPDLLRDRIRLIRFYRDQGFPDVQVDYRVVLDTVPNRVDVTFEIREGRARTLDSVRVIRAGGGSLTTELPAELRERWPRLERRLRRHRGGRLSSSLRIRLEDEVSNWLRNRGYPFPSVSGEVQGSGTSATLILAVDPGRRMRVGERRVEGNDALSDQVLFREVALKPGDWFDGAALADGEREILELDMVRFASARAVESSPPDSTVDLRLRVEDGLPHLLTGQVGYTTRSGVSADGSWSHRNFRGGARVLQISATARTGLLDSEPLPARLYGLAVLLRQPHFFHRRLAGILRPFAEYRDDVRDRSVEGGFESALLLQRGPRRSVSLRYAITQRHVLDPRPGGAIGAGENLVDLLQGLDTLDLDRRTSSVGLTARWGQGGGQRSWGWDARGTAEIAGPPELSTVEYGKLVLEASAGRLLLPWLRLDLRAGGGRVFPYGASVPSSGGENRLETYLKLRDATLTAGGPRDVRGWTPELLGPKIPDFRVVSGDRETLGAGHYIPLGGLARWTASVQLEVPFPFLGWPHGTHLFLDGGRIWTPDKRFLPTEEPLIPDQRGNDARFGAGVGVSFATPVGPLQVDLGYKLNPSLLDTRSPGAVARALDAGRDLATVEEESLARWHLHFSVGRVW